MARVLVIEEDESLGGLIRLYCQDEGHEAIRAGTMADALKTLEAGGFDLVLRDSLVGSPALFWEVPDPLFALDPRPPIVLVTGHRFDPQRLRAVGYAGFIQKPFDIDDFDRLFRDVLTRGDAWSP